MKRAADAETELIMEHDKESPPKQARLEEGARPVPPPGPALAPTKDVVCALITSDGTVETITAQATLDDPQDPEDAYSIGDGLDKWLGKDYEEADGAWEMGFDEQYWTFVGSQRDAWKHERKRFDHLKNFAAMWIAFDMGASDAMSCKFAWEGNCVIMGAHCRSLSSEEISGITARAKKWVANDQANDHYCRESSSGDSDCGESSDEEPESSSSED
jgi:hypothetical protein